MDTNMDLSAIMVVFGGTGDLTHRKLLPAVYNLTRDGLLPKNFALVAVGRREMTHEQYRAEAYKSLLKFSRNKIDSETWTEISRLFYYARVDFDGQSGYLELKEFLEALDTKYDTQGNRIYYLAVSPDYFEPIVIKLKENGLTEREKSWKRLVIEKPFGKDLKTARVLNKRITEVFPEDSIYRIDHYLGKEMIQNIMLIRFCNLVFESVWSSKFIDNIQISICESKGVGSRGGYYDRSGAMRDMVQNHILQILSLTAMEPPVSLNTEAVRNEKVKVIEAIEEVTPELGEKNVVFGQYEKGVIDGEEVLGYRQEEKVSPDSGTETFAALRVHINNFRWAGMPFYLRTGKRMKSNLAQIVVQFKMIPQILYFKDAQIQEPNRLVIKIQPGEGVSFQFNSKKIGTTNEVIPVKMDFCNNCSVFGNSPEAYEKIIFDILKGDTTLFARWDEVEASWRFADKILGGLKEKKTAFPNYKAGTNGPLEADELLTRDNRKWWEGD